jgi:hypothetical protein
MGEMRNAYKILIGKREGKRPRGVDRGILKCILEKYVWMVLNGLIWLRTGTDGGLL